MRSVALVAMAVAAVAVIQLRRRRRPCAQVSRLLTASKHLRRMKDDTGSLNKALEALELAREAAPDQAIHLTAQMHLACTYAKMAAYPDALAALDEAEALASCLYCTTSPELIPVLRKRAEILQRVGQPIAQAATVARARVILRQHHGENSLESAAASYSLASVLVCGSTQAGREGDGEAAYAVEVTTSDKIPWTKAARVRAATHLVLHIDPRLRSC